MDEHQTTSALFTELEAAFGQLPIPRPEDLLTSEPGALLECQDFLPKVQGLHWREIQPQDLAGEADSLSFLSPEGFQFLLPAFVKVSVLDPTVADLIPYSILWSLSGPDALSLEAGRRQELTAAAAARGLREPWLSALFDVALTPGNLSLDRGRVATLSEPQRRAILSFVRFLRQFRGDSFSAEDLDRAERVLES